MKLYSLFGLLAVTTAFTIEDVNDAVEQNDINPLVDEVQNNLNDALEYVKSKPLDEHVNDIVSTVKDTLADFPKTKAEANARFHKRRPKRERTAREEYILRQSHHSIRATRAELGKPELPRPGASYLEATQ